MSYASAMLTELAKEQPQVLIDLQNLQLQIVRHGQPIQNSRLREQLLHGAGRRVRILRRSIENIFRLFPPESSRPISEESIADIQVNLHAFVMNLYGIYDNWAWAFVLRHDLEQTLGDRRRVGLFIKATQRELPAALQSYLSSPSMTEWHEKYAKSYRDALAHRIPPYLPPAQFTPEEGERYNALENEKVECIKAMQWDRLEQVWEEQALIGTPCFAFLHAYSEDTPPRPVLLHPQLLSDAKVVIEFGNLFLAHWQERA